MMNIQQIRTLTHSGDRLREYIAVLDAEVIRTTADFNERLVIDALDTAREWKRPADTYDLYIALSMAYMAHDDLLHAERFAWLPWTMRKYLSDFQTIRAGSVLALCLINRDEVTMASRVINEIQPRLRLIERGYGSDPYTLAITRLRIGIGLWYLDDPRGSYRYIMASYHYWVQMKHRVYAALCQIYQARFFLSAGDRQLALDIIEAIPEINQDRITKLKNETRYQIIKKVNYHSHYSNSEKSLK